MVACCWITGHTRVTARTNCRQKIPPRGRQLLNVYVCMYIYIYRIIYICTLHDESCCPACFQLFTAFHQPPWFRCSTTQVVHLEAIESINSCVLEHLQDDFAVIKPFKRRISVEI